MEANRYRDQDRTRYNDINVIVIYIEVLIEHRVHIGIIVGTGIQNVSPNCPT